MTDIDTLRYPVGPIDRPTTPLDSGSRAAYLATIEELPARIRTLVKGLSDGQLETRYRPGGWTIRQLVHHIPDSHLNAYVRTKLAVTESEPAIKTYEEARWAELPDGKSAPIAMSLDLLDALHRRWVTFLRALPESDYAKSFVHPEWGRVSIDEAIGMYAWHSRHHAAHIELALGATVKA
jgi:DinB family protein